MGSGAKTLDRRRVREAKCRRQNHALILLSYSSCFSGTTELADTIVDWSSPSKNCMILCSSASAYHPPFLVSSVRTAKQ